MSAEHLRLANRHALCFTLSISRHHHNDFARKEVSSRFYSWEDYGSDRLSNLFQVTQKEAVKQGFKSRSVQPQSPRLFPHATITHIGWAPHQALAHQLPMDDSAGPGSDLSNQQTQNSYWLNQSWYVKKLWLLLATSNLILLKGKAHPWQSPGKLSL